MQAAWLERAREGGAFLTSITGSCLAASVVTLACCAAIIAVRGYRDTSHAGRNERSSRVALQTGRAVSDRKLRPIDADRPSRSSKSGSYLSAAPYSFSSFGPSLESRSAAPTEPELSNAEPLNSRHSMIEFGTPTQIPAEFPAQKRLERDECPADSSDDNGLVMQAPICSGPSHTNAPAGQSDSGSELVSNRVPRSTRSERPNASVNSSFRKNLLEVHGSNGEATSSRRDDGLARIPRLAGEAQYLAMQKLAPITQRADERIRHAYALADKGAVYSARVELESALQAIAHGLDAYHQTNAHAECLAAGLVAVREAMDFLPSPASARSRLSVAVIAARHQSPVLTQAESRDMESPQAIRRYCEFARERLVAAAGGLPTASHAYFGLGRLAVLQVAKPTSAERSNHITAMLLFQTALQVDGTNGSAANEFGVLLARDGRLDEAQHVLEHGISVQPLPESWRNLMIVNQRLGALEKSEQARREWQQSIERAREAQPGLVTAANGPSVQWVDKATFERGGHPSMASPDEGMLR